jgi:hypothetical protein
MPDGSEWYRYRPAVPDPNYPRYFVKERGAYRVHTLEERLGSLHGKFARVLQIKPGTDIVTQDVELELATALPVKIRDADGKPVTGCWVTGMGPENWHLPTEVKDDACAAYHLEGEPRLMGFYEPTRKRFGSLALKGDEKEPMTVTLGPGGAMKGRLVGEDGKPLAGVAVALHHSARRIGELHDHIHRVRPVETDSNGAFRIDDIMPGRKFQLSFSRRKTSFEPVTGPAGTRTVEPGKTTDAGELRLKAKRRGDGN